MKKKITSLFISLFLVIAVFSQSPVRITVLDFDTDDQINNAHVYINQVSSSDRFTDGYGAVLYTNLPTDRKFTVNVKKEGYKPKSIEASYSLQLKGDNNLIIKLERDYNANKVIIYGRVEDANKNDLSLCKVVLSYFGQNAQAITDSFGNYSISIEKGRFRDVKSYLIQVEVAGCEKFKSTEDYYNNLIINKNIVLSCPLKSAINNTQGNIKDQASPRSTYDLKGDWVIYLDVQYIRNKQGQDLTSQQQIEYTVSLKQKDKVSGTLLSSKRAIYSKGYLIGALNNTDINLQMIFEGYGCGNLGFKIKGTFQDGDLITGKFEPIGTPDSYCINYGGSFRMTRKVD